VVSTPIRDVVNGYGQSGVVSIAETADHFITAVQADRMPQITLDSLQQGTSGSCQHCAYDYLIVGAGFAGSVIAERLAQGMGQHVLLLDRREHIGGNAYDHYDDAGVLIHRYGPHIFHTNAQRIVDYLSRFTEWRPYEHRVLASVDGCLVPIPINLTTLNTLFNASMTPEEDFLTFTEWQLSTDSVEKVGFFKLPRTWSV
jgi:hypothetical protein